MLGMKYSWVLKVVFSLQSSQWGVCHLRHGLSEDVSGRTDWIRTLAHKSDAQVHSGLWWSNIVGERLQQMLDSVELAIFSWVEREQNLVCFIIIFSQREAKVQLFRDAVDAYSELITQVNKGRPPKSFCVLLKAYQPVFLLFRHWKDMESIATCWALSCRPSRKDTVFLKFSWTQRMVWQHTGSSEQDRCVSFVVFCVTEVDFYCYVKMSLAVLVVFGHMIFCIIYCLCSRGVSSNFFLFLNQYYYYIVLKNYIMCQVFDCSIDSLKMYLYIPKLHFINYIMVTI